MAKTIEEFRAEVLTADTAKLESLKATMEIIEDSAFDSLRPADFQVRRHILLSEIDIRKAIAREIEKARA